MIGRRSPTFRPISSAPRSGQPFMAFWPHRSDFGETWVKTWFRNQEFHNPWMHARPDDSDAPTHWMPLISKP